MVFRICKRFTVECGHILSKHSGQCRFPHGHSLGIEIVIESDQLDQNDMVCDLKTLKDAVHDAVGRLDHAFCINSAEAGFEELKRRYGDRLVEFKEMDPTIEVLAKTLFDEVETRLGWSSIFPAGLRVVRVRVAETENSWAECCRG